MHDRVSTHGGRYAFLATYTTQKVSEFEKQWGELPHPIPLVSLAFIVRGDIEDTVLLELRGEQFYFLNEVIAEPCASGALLERHVAKVFGVVHGDGTVTEVQVDLSGPTPHAVSRTLLRLPALPAGAFRPGLGP